jgi:hypothetical protein
MGVQNRIGIPHDLLQEGLQAKTLNLPDVITNN